MKTAALREIASKQIRPQEWHDTANTYLNWAADVIDAAEEIAKSNAELLDMLKDAREFIVANIAAGTIKLTDDDMFGLIYGILPSIDLVIAKATGKDIL